MVYAGPLPAANVFARMYIYAWLARFDPHAASGLRGGALDELLEWDHALVRRLLDRLMLLFAGVPSLDAGPANPGTGDALKTLWKYAEQTDAGEPWHVVARMLARPSWGLLPSKLEEVDVPLRGAFAELSSNGGAAPAAPRHTRRTARLVSTLARLESQLEGDVDLDEPGLDDARVRRSRRAEEQASKRRRVELQEEVERLRQEVRAAGADEGVEQDASEASGPALHLEAKVGILLRLCDALCAVPIVPPRQANAPPTSVTHALLEDTAAERASGVKRAARALGEVQEACTAEEQALQGAAPSMWAPEYEGWQQERKKLAETHTARVHEAQLQLYVAEEQVSGRSGPLGRDASGREYWHLVPGEAPRRRGRAGKEAPPDSGFSGHWSQTLVMYDEERGAFLGTERPEAVRAVIEHLQQGRGKRQAHAALVEKLERVRSYLSWV